MSPLAVVEQFDVLEQLAAGLSSGTPLALIDQFDFECGEKTFRHRVVPAIAFTAHAALDAVYRQQLLILVAGVLAAAIRVVQQTLRRLAVLQCHLEGVEHDTAFEPFAQRPADHSAREQIEDYRQVQPTLEGPHISNVGDPAAVGCGHCKPPLQQILLNWHAVPGISGAAEATGRARTQSCHAHQPRHPLAPGALAALAQLDMDPGAAVAAATLAINRRNFEPQPLIFLAMLGGRPFTPGVVSRARDFEYPAHQRHRIAGLLPCDKSESHSLSLAKKAVAFFRISRSSRSRRFSRRSSTNSSRSLRFNAPSAPRPASTSACSTQRLSAVSPIPSSSASWPMLLPLRCTSCTVSALYSAENFRRFRLLSFPTVHSSRADFCAFRSVHQTGASPLFPLSRRKGGQKASAAAGKNRHQLLRWNHFELGIGALARFFVVAPPSKLRRVTEASALHMLISDFHHQLGPQRFPR